MTRALQTADVSVSYGFLAGGTVVVVAVFPIPTAPGFLTCDDVIVVSGGGGVVNTLSAVLVADVSVRVAARVSVVDVVDVVVVVDRLQAQEPMDRIRRIASLQCFTAD